MSGGDFWAEDLPKGWAGEQSQARKEPQEERRRQTAWRARQWQGAAGPTWLADAGVALPLVLADTVGRAGAGVAGARHAAASLHSQGMAGLGQHGPSDAVTQSHTLQRR